MLSTTLAETEYQIKAPEIDGRDRPPDTEPAAREGSIMLTISLSGITFLQILADESATEERLRERLIAARPILEQLHEAIRQLPQGPCSR